MIGPLARPLAQSASNSLLAGAGGGSSASLDIRASVGTSTSPAVSGDSSVTGVGFQPKCVIPFYGYQSSAGAASEGIISLGAATASAQAAISATSVTGMTTSSTHRRHTNASILTDSWGGATDIAASRTSLDAGGFTLNWNIGISRLFNHIALGGADLEVSLVQCQMNGTNAAQSFAHGLSGAPTGVLFLGISELSAPPYTDTYLSLILGAWAGASQWSAGAYSSHGVTTTSTRRVLLSDSVLSDLGSTGVGRSLAVSTVDATNVNVTYPVTGNSYQYRFWMLCIRGAKCQVGTFNCNGSTSPLTITTTGITPKLFLPVSVQSGVSSSGTVSNDLIFSIGACDGTNNVSCGITDKNGVTTTNARRFQSSTSLSEYGPNGTLSFEGTAAFSGESVILTPTTASGGYGQAGYLVIGS